MRIDRNEVERHLSLLFGDDGVFEVRAPHVRHATFNGRPDPRSVIATGYFDSPALAAAEIERVFSGGEFEGIYATVNPARAALLARAANRLKPAAKGASTSDQDIERRRRLLVDIDPERPSGISSTDAEKEQARELAEAVREFLRERGWPDPIVVDSGNGFHLIYEVSLPTDDAGLVARVLEALAARFDNGRVKVDRTVANAGRVAKVAGTLVAKGDSTPDRPHRMARLVSVPDELEPVPTALLEALASEVRPAAAAPKPSTAGTFQLEEFIARYLPHARGPERWSGGERWIVDPCPFNAEHTGTSAAILRQRDGTLAFKCQHNGCVGREWREVRALYEPVAGARNGSTPAKPAGDPAQAAQGGAQNADGPSWVDLEAYRKSLRIRRDTKQPTGIPTLDKQLGGGLPGGVILTLIGRPGSLKTGLAIMLALDRARRAAGGRRAFVWLPDQGATQALDRLSSTFGDVVDDPVAWRRFLDEAAAFLMIADETTGWTLEAYERAVRDAGDTVAAVVIDALQAVEAEEDAEERIRINRAMAAARRLTTLAVPVIVCSHANRAATAARKGADRTHPLAAALGSAAVEHRSQIALFMEGDDEADPPETTVLITKNAGGGRGGPIRLRLDLATWRLYEIEGLTPEEEARIAVQDGVSRGAFGV